MTTQALFLMIFSAKEPHLNAVEYKYNLFLKPLGWPDLIKLYPYIVNLSSPQKLDELICTIW